MRASLRDPRRPSRRSGRLAGVPASALILAAALWVPVAHAAEPAAAQKPAAKAPDSTAKVATTPAANAAPVKTEVAGKTAAPATKPTATIQTASAKPAPPTTTVTPTTTANATTTKPAAKPATTTSPAATASKLAPNAAKPAPAQTPAAGAVATTSAKPGVTPAAKPGVAPTVSAAAQKPTVRTASVTPGVTPLTRISPATPSPAPAPGPDVTSVEERVTYVYNALGRRDPFMPLVGGGYVGADEQLAPPDVGGIKVVGIVWGAQDKFALAEDPRGNSMVLRQGDKVMNGVVDGLRRDKLIIKLTNDGSTEYVEIPLTRKGESK